jgi:prephenate dehydratase
MNKVISFQGEPGANSHIACSEARPDWQVLPCPTFEDAFAAVNEDQAGLAMIPIENSIAGRVADIHHLLPTSGLHIIGEHFLPIHFQLMALPEASLSAIRSVHSHVHALGQCRKIIRTLGLKAHVAGDTAGSAREVAEWKDPTRASLAPALAAGIYGLKILAEDVEDEAHNTTRFIILSRRRAGRPRHGPTVTSFVFRVRNLPPPSTRRSGGLRDQRRQHDEARELHAGGRLHRDPVLCEVDGHRRTSTSSGRSRNSPSSRRSCGSSGVFPAHPFRDQVRAAAE